MSTRDPKSNHHVEGDRSSPHRARAWRSIVVLAGGVGGARFIDGLARALDPASLVAIVNTGDDFEHWGLSISPDLDTVMYTLAGLANEERGWGLTDESFNALGAIKRYGGESWFALGDRDLATHLLRTEALRRGVTLTQTTERLCRALGIGASIRPMCDAPRRTIIETRDEGAQPFQTWFVRHGARPAVRAVRFEGTEDAAPGILETIRSADVVFIAPSNPYVSIDPILTLRGVREAVFARPAIAVSPIVRGRAIKGPLASMIEQIAGIPATAGAIARHYEALSGLVVEHGDEESVRGAVRVHRTNAIMTSRDDRVRLAREVLAFAETIA